MTKRANTGRGTHGDDLQCVTPDHTAQMGDVTGADVIISDGSSNESATAPRDGVAIVTIPAITVRIRIGTSVTAGANDQAYIGADTWHFPIQSGEVVSIRGDGGAGTATVSMAR